MGAVFFAPTRCSLVRISARDLVADRKNLVRNSGVGVGVENLILIFDPKEPPGEILGELRWAKTRELKKGHARVETRVLSGPLNRDTRYYLRDTPPPL